MSKKILNTSMVLSELSGQSVYFRKESPKGKLLVADSQSKDEADNLDDSQPPSNHDSMPSRDHETTVSRYHDTTIETVRKAVKEIGKEAATHRFTIEEKRAIADLVYTYKRQGVRTSENQIARIAVNFIFQDHNENGENSLIDQVLKALNE
jgi:hypothetical protein